MHLLCTYSYSSLTTLQLTTTVVLLILLPYNHVVRIPLASRCSSLFYFRGNRTSALHQYFITEQRRPMKPQGNGVMLAVWVSRWQYSLFHDSRTTESPLLYDTRPFYHISHQQFVVESRKALSSEL